MLSCRELTDLGDALLAGELHGRRLWSVRLHLLMCRHCRRYITYMRRMLHTLPGMRQRASEVEIERILCGIHQGHGGADHNTDPEH